MNIKKLGKDLLDILCTAIFVVCIITIYDDIKPSKPPQPVFDVYKRDNTIHKV